MSEILVSVDPGLRVCGVAIFEDRVLMDTRAVAHDCSHGPGQRTGMAGAVMDYVASKTEGVDSMVVELMVIRKDRGRSPSRGDVHADLIRLSHVTGAIWFEAERAYACSLVEMDPGRWTKGRKKKINHPRIVERLSPEEVEVLTAELKYTHAGSEKEILDAIGIGLYELGRL